MSELRLPETVPGATRMARERQRERPAWCFQVERTGALALGDWVTVEGVKGLAEIVEMFSHRLAGGLVVTVRYPGGVWLRQPAKKITPVLSVNQEDRR